jgi:hypothetical protein
VRMRRRLGDGERLHQVVVRPRFEAMTADHQAAGGAGWDPAP